MMNSFAELWEKTCKQQIIKETASLHPEMDNTQSSVVLAKQEPEFCDQLAKISNANSIALAELLGIEPEVVKKWHSRIRQAIKMAERAKAETQQQSMMPTGV